MSQFVETACKTFTAAAARAQYLRVKRSGSDIATAGVDDVCLGTQERASLATTDEVAVRLRTAQGSRKVVAAGAITAGAKIYAAAAGKVAATGQVLEGIALEAATADGDIIEAVLVDNFSLALQDAKAVTAAGSTQADAAALTGVLNVVAGADGTKGVVLPTAALGMPVIVYSSVATNGLKIYPAADDAINGGTADAAITIEGKTMALLIPTAVDNWGAIFTANT